MDCRLEWAISGAPRTCRSLRCRTGTRWRRVREAGSPIRTSLQPPAPRRDLAPELRRERRVAAIVSDVYATRLLDGVYAFFSQRDLLNLERRGRVEVVD